MEYRVAIEETEVAIWATVCVETENMTLMEEARFLVATGPKSRHPGLLVSPRGYECRL